MKHFYTYFIIIFLLFTTNVVTAQSCSMKCVVKDLLTHEAVDMANASIIELAQGAITDEKGVCEIKNINKGIYHLRISYLGYETIDTLIQINKSINCNFFITKTSLQLKEVNVMAREKKQSATTSTIKLAAIEHLQPSSLTDILQMLPGGLLSDSKLNVANQVSMRQAGSDVNTAMGTAIVVDGVPMSNNVNMQSFYGSNNAADVSTAKSTVNSGVDLRQLSTDHINEVEVIRGIPSVKYGDLTSGAIIVKSKKGETPLTLRVKSDPLNKLVYVGKGYRLPKDAGTINFGIDYTKFVADQRSPFDQYERITSNLSYDKLIKKVFLSTTQMAFTGTIDKSISDPDIMNKEDVYKSDYKSFKLSNSGSWNINKGMLYKLEYTLSANYAQDVLDRTKTVTLNSSSMGISLSDTVGHSPGLYLPAEFLSTYKIDGKPFNFYSQITTYLHPRIGKTFNNVLLGAEFRLDKNFGEGSIYDLTRPPFPTQSSSSRPRAPKDIPALEKLTVFAEDNFTAKIGESKLGITAGVRGTTLSNLSSKSAMYNKFYVEPRLNINFQLPEFQLFESKFEFGLKGGVGDQMKFPTTMQLYPEKAYYDIYELNYYPNVSENRLIYLLTTIKDRTNNDLTPARNRKYEVGFDVNYKGISLNVTAFREEENNGFEQQSLYFPQIYNYYDSNSYTGSGRPTINDLVDKFTHKLDTMFLSYSYNTNASIVIKKGIEYQLSTKKIAAINTEIVVNGAWFQTQYDISQPRYKYINIVLNGENNYHYVGIFNAGSDSKVQEQFNTTIFLNTHFSKQRLMFSTSIQTLWYTSYLMMQYSGIPDSYIDSNGNIFPFPTTLMTKEEKLLTDEEKLLNLLFEGPFNTAYFDAERSTISVGVNLKVTKEIGNNMKLSFFVNRILDYNPPYKSRFGVTTQKFVTPFMGAEIQIKL